MAKSNRNNKKFTAELQKRWLTISQQGKQLAHRVWAKLSAFINRRPLVAFLSLMAILIALIAVGNFLHRPPTAETEPTAQPKQVEIYHFTDTPKITLTAKIQKAGVLNIVAQTPGVVQKINFHEGDRVTRSSTLMNLSSNYRGGNAPVLARQLAHQ